MAIQVDLVASALAAPTFATSAPGVADRLFITEKDSGRIVVLDTATNQVSAQAFFDVPAAEMSSAGEGGLLGLAFHPAYASNGKAYLNLTNEAGDTEIWEIAPSGTRVLLTIDRTAANHVGGWIGFGPDGLLYIASGDSGGAGDPQNAAQNVNDLRGKILRIDVDSDAIPAGNPFGNEVFAYGLRNPWRASFDRATGDLYIGDVGQAAREEIDFLAAGTGAGTNFGWRVMEGSVPTGYPPLDNPPPNDPGLTAPIHEYGHDQGRTIIGGYVYRGPGGAQGEYFFADFITDHLWTARVVNGQVVEVVQRDAELVVNGGTFDQIVSFAEDSQGRLYAIGLDGEIFRLTPGGNVATINGTAGNDTLSGTSGTSGNDTINGLGGNDLFLAGESAGGGADVIDGGAGLDSIEFRERATSGVVVDFVAGTITGGGPGTISFTNIERVVTGNFNDSLTGNGAAQTLTAQAGADTLWGAGGVDTLWGGGGADTFVFREVGTAHADRISDWASGSDKLLLDGSVMSALGANGNFAAGDARFWSSTSGTANDADDRIIFNTTTRQVFYDADGNGSGAAQLIATLSSATLVATDIVVEGGSGGQSINGTAGNDSLVGGEGDDTLNGLGGNDTLDGGFGEDLLLGGDGNDWLIDKDVHADRDTLDGGLGNDTYEINSSTEFTLLDAGGIDTIIAFDNIVLPGGIEHLRFRGGGPPSFCVGNELDNFITIESGVFVTTFADGADGNDTILGGIWQDMFTFNEGSGNYGNDSVNGGDENDEMSFLGARSAVTLDMRTGIATGGGTGGSGSVSFSAIEMIVGGSFDDHMTAHDGAWVPEVDNETSGGAFKGASFQGEEGNDTLIGGAAVDGLSGGAGDDWLSGGAENDHLHGGAGADTFAFDVAPGEANADSLNDFVSGQDKIALDRADHANLGAAGNFTVGDARFAANTTGAAQDASDRVIHNTNTGELWYDADGTGAGEARLIASVGSVVATDIVAFGESSGTIVGTEGDDSLTGTDGADSIEGRGGNDTIDGQGGNDTLDGGTGDDGLVGGDGNDTINGLADHDILWGGAGDDLLDGGDGSDQLLGQGGDDTLLGGAGNDWFSFDNRPEQPFGQDAVDGGSGVDTISFHSDSGGVTVNAVTGTFTGPRPGDGGTLTGIENFLGTLFADAITGDGTANLIHGGGGGDTLDGGAGNDTLSGSFFGTSSDLLVGGDGDDSLVGGGNGNDTLRGGNGDDILVGGWASDVVAGDAGNDLVRGNGGNDTLTGGAGADGFFFEANPHPANAVFITEFATGIDKLRLAASSMPAIGAGGNFTSIDARFHAAPGATGGHDADDRIIYNTSTGELFYDADGSGAGAAQLIATLQGAPAFAATDIAVDGGDGPGQVFTGTPGNDSLVGTNGNDTLDGLDGHDTLDGVEGDDVLNGGAGNDSLVGGRGFDHLAGGEGNDILNGYHSEFFGDREAETDTLEGGAGDDVYFVDNSGDSLSDSGGIDTVRAADMGWTLAAGFENLVIANDVSEGGYTGIGNELDNHISASYASSRLEGRGGNDTLLGGDAQGGNRLFGDEGNDSLRGGGLPDSLDGGSGNDTLDGLGFDDTYAFSVAPGAANADRIRSFDVDSSVIQLDGNVHANIGVSGRIAAGDGRFHSAAGASAGHDADDRVVYNTTTGELFYDADGNGAGAAQLIATLQGAPSLTAANIEVINGSAANVFTGTAGDDSLVGTSTQDTIIGLGGNDTLDGLAGNDSLDGGTGNDTYFVQQGDVLSDAGGIDLVIATGWTLGAGFENLRLINGGGFHIGTGNELANVIDGRGVNVVSLSGGGGNDTLYGTDGFQANDNLGGGDGDDEIHGGGAGDSIHGDAGNDMLFGDDGNDALAGGQGNDAMFGGAGDDHFHLTGSGVSEIGQDSADGGAGFDTLQYRSLDSSAVVVDFASGTAVGGGPDGSGRVTFTGIERVSATRFADELSGDASNNSLMGNEGDDTLDGRAGSDLLDGGAGADRFLFTVAPTGVNADVVVGFATSVDKIQLDAAVYTNIGASGNFAASDARFFVGAGASAGQDATDRVIYNTTNGQLWYDADGSGSSAAQLIATLSGAPAFTATDIEVVGGGGSGQVINGTAGNDTLAGTAGNDTINGLGGNDLFVAGSTGGTDVVDGGAGIDSIEFRERATSGVVVDFVTGTISGGAPAPSASPTSSAWWPATSTTA